jgi:hypothetical protein
MRLSLSPRHFTAMVIVIITHSFVQGPWPSTTTPSYDTGRSHTQERAWQDMTSVYRVRRLEKPQPFEHPRYVNVV